ncbi:MAG: hypothetical protein KDH15_18730 [Rhodocyclaceae bacterium]|nr:hypothetical protein [Rhodocyclaceae bacterium]
MYNIRIHNRDFSLRARIDDSDVGRRVVKALPFHAHARVRGQEIYFGTSLKIDLPATASAEVKVGDLAYLPTGGAFCIFFGPTPDSVDDRPRAAGPVAVFGQLLDDHRPLTFVKEGEMFDVELA